MILSILILCIFFIFTTIVLVLLHHFFRVKKQSVSNNDLVYDDDLDVIETTQETSEHSKMRAVVFCSPDRTFSAKRFNYKGQKDCNLFKMLYETEGEHMINAILFEIDEKTGLCTSAESLDIR